MGTFVRKDSASSRKPGADADTPGQAWGFGVGLRADAWAGGPASALRDAASLLLPRTAVPAPRGACLMVVGRRSALPPRGTGLRSHPDPRARHVAPRRSRLREPPCTPRPRHAPSWIALDRAAALFLRGSRQQTPVRCRPPCSLSARQTFFPRRGQSVTVQTPTASV